MTFAATATTIRTRFNTEFAAVRPTVPIHWPNEVKTPPSGTPWVRLTIVEGESGLIAMGGANSNLYRNPGLVVVQIFVPISTLDNLGLQIADDVATIFRSQFVSGVRFRTPSTSPIGPDGPWYQRNVTVPFTADQIA